MTNTSNKGGNTALIKRNNLSLIIRLVREMETISRTELSVITGLSKGGLTPIIQELIDTKILSEGGVMDSHAGRKPVVLEINPEVAYVISVDLNRSSMQIGLVNLNNDLQSFYEHKYTCEESAETIVPRLKSMIRFFLDQNSEKRIVAIAVSVPGPLDYQKGIILNPPNFKGWKNLQLKKILEEEFGILTILDKDANAYAMAEKVLGHGKDYEKFVCVTHCEGVGSGIVLNNQLYRGVRGFGTELGHVIVDDHGIQCDCGNRGCLEKYASMTAIIQWVESTIATDNNKANTYIKVLFERNGKLEWDDILDGLERHIPICLEAMEYAGNYLSNGLISMINIFAPEAVIIGGRSVFYGKYFLKSIKEAITKHSFFREHYIPDILISDIKDGALIGIANIAFEYVINECIEVLLMKSKNLG